MNVKRDPRKSKRTRFAQDDGRDYDYHFKIDVGPAQGQLLPEVGKLLSRRGIFDPLQWLIPVIIAAKILIQKIWQAEIGWDDIPSDDILATLRSSYRRNGYSEKL